MCTVVAVVKSEDKTMDEDEAEKTKGAATDQDKYVPGGGLEQTVEQMLGLFMGHQSLMLGLVFHSWKIQPLLLRRVGDDLILTELKSLSLTQPDIVTTMMTLMKMLVGINAVCGP